jgi:inosine/xanthosine triphosphate pyrophosphatase family protein
MADIPDGQRSARFYAVIVLLRHATDPQPLICEGRWEGRSSANCAAPMVSATTRCSWTPPTA